MKALIITGAALVATTFSACNGNNNSKGNSLTADATAKQSQSTASEAKSNSPINDITTAYLQIKNGLANDNPNDAAAGGNAFVTALGKVDKTAMTANQRKSYEDIADDAKEMAEHIGKSAGRIEHQREHFDMLSKDIYDLVKTFRGGQVLYQDFCPMYNNKKGATWLSETKEIKNPYLGKKMRDCGSVKETIQ